ncbi:MULTISPECIES: acyl-CoA carboxylase subunit epsilon [Streptomycetaceae]|uniref:Acyl-CoA carboxylase subunit epsilon n=1 Tax=Streptantibioticus cattleyicolor (strain ATCC 35852 / DSM 46488 / JCM 4925 / NBRC 14057 / NRRL 8057) TaxID=1003195 RepID=F8JSK1_STREN|nr:acyl-CoA carboxylase subunit epsilon [Streptantibioticus cattleyicolor]AEW96727.1 hypothetical protein SCATT_43560 [Streptantibioticus cattleyicolor NRRL 8057 = DSM 46488]MYS61214.1 acyl-CoA carboxylase subunit epsilon [Streptomyces sp. SID5468]CCB77063.1 conserved protein of unknown function [Streptantibioticus cattleyicolor NRRL 8057 = DSM 46488]
MSTPAEPLVRVERGHAEPEELAAITAVLLARACAARPARPEPVRAVAHWRRLERSPGFQSAHSWQAVA